jgi:hypothetical protein
MSSRAVKDRAIHIREEMASVKDLPMTISCDVANELIRQPEMIEPIYDSLMKLSSILPSLGLEKTMRLEVVDDPVAYPKPRFRIVVTSTAPLPPQKWMRDWDLISDAIDEPMRTYELRRRVLLYLDPRW